MVWNQFSKFPPRPGSHSISVLKHCIPNLYHRLSTLSFFDVEVKCRLKSIRQLMKGPMYNLKITIKFAKWMEIYLES